MKQILAGSIVILALAVFTYLAVATYVMIANFSVENPTIQVTEMSAPRPQMRALFGFGNPRPLFLMRRAAAFFDYGGIK